MKIIAAVFIFLIFFLLVGARFNFTWAGGSGYERPMTATVETYSPGDKNETTVKRGQLIKTGSGETAVVQIGERIIVAVDERSDVVLDKLFPSEVKLTLRGGRILAKTSRETEKLTISSPETSDFITSGLITAVRYDALDRTDIVPLENYDWTNSSDSDFLLWAAGMMEIGLP
jgi:hypothetical protein